MKVSKETKLKHIQQVFVDIYRGLDLKFYIEKHEMNSGSYNSDELDLDVMLGELNNNFMSTILSMDDGQTAFQFE